MEGAFEGLENIIRDRTGEKAIGFGKQVKSQKDVNQYEIFKELLPQDLLKVRFSDSEFIGRLPIIATLKDLDKEALIKILVEPKNSLVKQYQKLFEIDGVELVFEQEALEAIVDKAIERKTGARGLRSIIEEIMRDIMFEIPSNPNIEKCIITKATVSDNAEPKIVINENKERLKPVAEEKRQMPKTVKKKQLKLNLK